MQLAIEVLAVAAATAVLYVILDRALKALGYNRVPGFVIAGVVGGLAHLILDVTGANAWYCVNGAACTAAR